MTSLVDTHAVIWFITDSKFLSPNARTFIQNSENDCLISMASLWEIAIKFSLNRLDLKTELRNIFHLIEESGFIILPITSEHVLTSAALDFHHRDPFDRLIIAQAQFEQTPLITKDKAFQQYEAKLIW